MKDYNQEVKQCYGDTEAYREYNEKTKNYTKEKRTKANDGLMAIFAEFAVLKGIGVDVASAESQVLVAKLQSHITENYYTCTDNILAGLGKMYIEDERFKKNIDKHGEGTAEFASKAIESFCAVK